jgi:hypothetical protein
MRGNKASESGAALLTVLTVLTGVAIVVSLLLDRNRADILPWVAETQRTQAVYSAESGIAYQLYLERFSDSSEPSFGAAKSSDSLDPFATFKAPTDTFVYRMDRALGVPDVHVDRTRAFLDVTSTGRYRNASATVFARFGRALDDSIFGPALTLENAEPLEPYPSDRINGAVRLKQGGQGTSSAAWPTGFSVAAYATEFTDKKYNALEASLQKKLGEEGGQSGNGSFTPDNPPVFKGGKDLFFPLGRV